MSEIKFFIPGKPKPLKRHRDSFSGGKYDPSAADKNDFLVKALQLCMPGRPIQGPVKLILGFSFARPKSHFHTSVRSKVLKNDAPVFYSNTPDLDNLVKFVCDALTPKFWEDDRQVAILKAYKKYSTTEGTDVRIIKID